MPSKYFPGVKIAELAAEELVLHDAAAATSDGQIFLIDGYASLLLEITGTFVATVSFYASADPDGLNWFLIRGQNLATGSQVTSASAPGVFAFSVNGLKRFRAPISGYTSGSVTVRARALVFPFAGLTPLGTVEYAGRLTSKEVNATATTTDQSASFDVEWISHIINDGSVDLYIAFDADSTVAANRITLKPGEVINDLPRKCAVLHFSCASGTCPFRAVGVK